MNEVQIFEEKHLQAFKKLADVTKAKKEIEKQEKDIKAKLEKAMNTYDIKSIDNEYIKITRVDESTSTSLDLKEFKKKEPRLYDELLTDYPKVTKRKPHLRFKVK